MQRAIYEGYVFEFEGADGHHEYYLAPTDDAGATTFIGPDGSRHSGPDIMARLGRDMDDWYDAVLPIPISQNPDAIGAFKGSAVVEYIKLVRHHLRVECPGCSTTLVDADTVKSLVREQKYEILADAVAGGLAGVAPPAALGYVVFKVLHERRQLDGKQSGFGVERKEGLKSDQWACSACGVTIYP